MEFESIEKQANKKKVLCLTVQLGGLGTRRSISSEIVDSEADKSLVHVAKDILESQELKEIRGLDAEIRNYLRRRALPAIFKRGFYLIPLALVEEVDTKIEEFYNKREILVEKFILAYPSRKAEAEERLKDLYQEKDYPPVEFLKVLFYMKHQYVSFGAPEDLTYVSREIFEKEQKKAALYWSEAVDDIQAGLREGFSQLVEHLLDRLGSTNNGKPKKLHASAVEHMKDFLSVFDSRNVSDDAELASLVSKARGLIEGVSPETLRSDKELRTAVRDGIAQIKEQLDPMIVDKPSRKYFLENSPLPQLEEAA